MSAVTGPFSEDRDGLRLVQFRQDLDAFLEGSEISIAENPDAKPSDAMMARIHPVTDEFWDIRSISPNPGIRAFGGFSAKDEFIALIWNYRENLEGRWDEEVEDLRRTWVELFGTERPMHGANLDAYLSNFIAV
jgi:hypothetical protein